MRLYSVAWVVVSSVLLVIAAPAKAKSTKYTKEEIVAEKTCRNDDPATPVDKCMKKFGEKFCEDKGHNSYLMINWSSSDNGYSDPDLIYCN